MGPPRFFIEISKDKVNKMNDLNLLEGVLDHRRYEPREVGARQLKARVGVDLDHPGVHVLVNHEVVAEDLERRVLPARVHLAGHRPHRVLDQLSYLWADVLREVALDPLTVKVLLELGIAQLVARLELSVVVQLLLDCIICQVDVSIGHVLKSELTRARPQVAIGVPIALQVASDRTHHREAPDVELAILVEQRFLDVLLDDVGASVAVYVGVLDQRLDVVDVSADLDAAAAVRVLAWLDDPEGLAELGELVQQS